MPRNLGSEQCAIACLKQGFYPLQEASDKSYFQAAASSGMIELMSILAGMNAQFMHEDWLIQKQLPDRLVPHTDFVSGLLEYRKQTPSLQQLCKSRILSQLEPYYVPQIDTLQLPTSLKHYLAAVESLQF